MQKEKLNKNYVGADASVRPNSRGITLIALIITIIVMLILVGVTVTVALNGGLFSSAQDATGKTQLEADKEQLLELAIGAIGTEGKVVFSDLDAAVLADGKFTKTDDGTYKSVKSGNTFTVGDYGSITQASTEEPTEPENPSGTVAITPKKENYTVGEEVTIGDEHFFVIDNTAEKVTLLAKYNLNKEGTAQLNATHSETACDFSNASYWTSETEYPLDLNTYTIPEGSVITKAKEYGETIGGDGRLMRRDEAETLVTTYPGIIYGTSIEAYDGYLFYWTGSASSSSTVSIVNGSDFGGCIATNGTTDSKSLFGVRPVIEISKSDIL